LDFRLGEEFLNMTPKKVHKRKKEKKDELLSLKKIHG